MEDDLVVLIPSEQLEEKLDKFRQFNKTGISWDSRVEEIKKEFPSVVNLDWFKVFKEDVTVMGNIINDIMKIELATPGKPGKRPAVDPQRAAESYRDLSGEDFTMLPFTEAFLILAGQRSIRGLAAKTGLDRNVIVRLMKGGSPSASQMEMIARGFKKDPGFFLEYRLSYLFGVLYRKLEVNPEATVGFYRKVKGLASK